MSSLKQKTLAGLSWSFADNFASQGIAFTVQVILARLIDPEEFGVVTMIAIFIALSITFIDSGFGQALIRKKNCTQADYSTVFFFNLAIGIVLYILLYFSAPLVADFFNEPRVSPILRVAGLVLIINAASVIQLTLLIKNIDFKTKTKISLSAELLSGGIAIVMAFRGFGIWSLVARSVLVPLFTAVFIWLSGKWHPAWIFSIKSFKELFGFGYKLLLSTLINTASRNIYSLIIGKFFSAATLGFYGRAEQFNNIFSSTLTTNIQRVSYPVLASIQDDPEKLKKGYRKLIKSTMMVAFSLMLGLAAVAEPLITVLIGEQWLPCVPYLQLMCFASMLYPLHAMNLNAITVKGRSDLFLKLEIIKQIIDVPLILIGIFLGVEALLIGSIVMSFACYFLNSYYSANLIHYSTGEQLWDILPLLTVAGAVSLLVWGVTFLHMNNWATLMIQVAAGAGLTVGIYEAMKQPDYKEMKQIVLQTIHKLV
ncbi:MAG: lipopolysaccharide biosynthesis protein [Bacteroidales bacterium]|jgi:O-antigen/teichoic acid export membrane protein|nr:lipopolysaccharide biosynthesis protein [Bacteroidales bacterium]